VRAPHLSIVCAGVHLCRPIGRAHRRLRRASRRAAGRAAVGLALSTTFLGAGLAVTQLPAYASVISGYYTIGSPSGAVSAVSAAPSSVSAGASTEFSVTFTAAASLSGADGGWITVTPSESLGTSPAGADVIDTAGASCLQAGTEGVGGAGMATTTELMVELSSSCSIAAGDKVDVTFRADAPSSAGNLSFTVTTSDNESPATSNNVTVGTSSTSSATLSAGSVGFGANTTYSISGAPVANVTASNTRLVLSSVVTQGTEAITFYGAPTGYTVTYTPPGGVATQDAVTAVALSGASDDVATLTLAEALDGGDTLDITAIGTNPAPASSPQADAISVVAGNGTSWTTSPLSFGGSVTGVTVSMSTAAAGAAATYVVRFQASSPVAAGGYVFLRETGGPTDFATVTGVLVADATRSWQYVATSPVLSDGQANIPVSQPIETGDFISLTLANVTNPPAPGTISDFSVSTSTDTVPADVTHYSITSNANTGVVVTVSPATTGSLATYTISGLVASAPMSGGISTLSVQGPSGTVFPNNAGYYSVQDSTTPSGSGAVVAAVDGGGTNDVTLTVPESIITGDRMSLVIHDAINPAVPSADYSISVLGSVSGPSAVLLPGFPLASASYPNGAIVSFAGTDYVFAGGRAFEVTGPTALAALERVDHATVQAAPAGASPPSGAPRPGTLIFTRPINGVATIYVAGTDGDLHGFATPAQFLGDGYDAALVVTVPSLGGLTVGAPAGQEGAAANALATSADGAIVITSGTYFVFAGGRAFGIPNPAALDRVRAADKAKVIFGTVSVAQRSATLANGVLLSAAGPVYVTYLGHAWELKSMAQLVADGYAGTAGVPVPGIGGITVSSYSGS